MAEELATARARGSLRDADPFVATGLPATEEGFELRSSRAITIENKTPIIAQPPYKVSNPSLSVQRCGQRVACYAFSL